MEGFLARSNGPQVLNLGSWIRRKIPCRRERDKSNPKKRVQRSTVGLYSPPRGKSRRLIKRTFRSAAHRCHLLPPTFRGSAHLVLVPRTTHLDLMATRSDTEERRSEHAAGKWLRSALPAVTLALDFPTLPNPANPSCPCPTFDADIAHPTPRLLIHALPSAIVHRSPQRDDNG